MIARQLVRSGENLPTVVQIATNHNKPRLINARGHHTLLCLEQHTVAADQSSPQYDLCPTLEGLQWGFEHLNWAF